MNSPSNPFVKSHADQPLTATEEPPPPISIPGDGFLLSARFERSGKSDLLLKDAEGGAGRSFLIQDYFSSETLPDLMTHDGTSLTGDVVMRLAGTLAPATYAEESPALTEGAVGKVVSAQGDVWVVRRAGDRFEATGSLPVFEGDVVETAAGGSVGLIFADESTFSLGDASRMVVEKVSFDPESGDGQITHNVVQGVFSFISGEIARSNPDAMVIQTPVASIGVRGTAGSIKVELNGKTTGALIEEVDPATGKPYVGEMSFTNDAGTRVINKPFQATSIATVNTPPSQPFTLSAQEFGKQFGSSLVALPKAESNLPRAFRETVTKVHEESRKEEKEDEEKEGEEGEGEGEAEGNAEGETEAEGRAEGEAEAEDEAETEGEAETEAEAEGRAEGEGVEESAEAPDHKPVTEEGPGKGPTDESIMTDGGDEGETIHFQPPSTEFTQLMRTMGEERANPLFGQEQLVKQNLGNLLALRPYAPDDADDPIIDNSVVEAVATQPKYTTTGELIDGYISGATVFGDANENGVLDNGESWTTTDEYGGFTLSNATGSIVAIGGTDISTGAAHEGVLKAAAGSKVISPLTTMVVTLVESGSSQTTEEAEASVKASLGLDEDIDLATFDPVEETYSDDAETAAKAKAVMAAAVMVQNTVVQVASALSGAGADKLDVTDDVFAQLAQKLKDGGNLTDSDLIKTIIVDTAATDAVKDAVDAAKVDMVADGAAQTIVSGNASLETLAASGKAGANLLTEIAKVAKVAQGDAADSIASAAQSGDAASAAALTSSYTGTAFTDKIDDAAADVGEVATKELQQADVDDVLVGTDAEDQFFGFGGEDALSGGGGNDLLDGGAHNDVLEGGSGHDELFGGSGDDRLSGGAGEDKIFGGGDDDLLEGDSGDDVLGGGDGHDRLVGGEGNDALMGGDGEDSATFDGSYGGYELRYHANGLEVIDRDLTDGDDGTDRLDGIESLVFADLTLAVTGNADPVAALDAVAVDEDDAVTFSPLDNDADFDHNALTLQGVEQPSHGQVSVGDDGQLTYTPDSNYFGTDQFTYLVNDGLGGEGSGIVILTVNPMNDAPAGEDDAFTLNRDSAVSGALEMHDPDGDPLEISVLTGPAHGAVTLLDASAGLFSYVPDAGYVGADAFEYVVLDGNTSSAAATVNLTVNDTPPPEALDGTLSTQEDVAVSGQLLGRDFVGREGEFTFEIVDAPTNGALALTDAAAGSFTYTPDLNKNVDADGLDTFTFRVNNGSQDSDLGAFTVTVNAVNDAPTLQGGDSFSINEDTAHSGSFALRAGDVDGDALTFAVADAPAKGAVLFDPNTPGSFTYTPAPNANGADAFTYTVSDGEYVSAPVQVTIDIAPVNDLPVPDAAAFDVNEDGFLVGDLTGSDVEGEALTYDLVTTPTKGILTLTDAATGAFLYTPDANANGADSFTFRVSDDGGTTYSTAQTVTMSITPVNDAPSSQDPTALTTTWQDAVTGVLTATDIDNDDASLTFVMISGPTLGTVSGIEDGSFIYTPTTKAPGEDSFTFVATDGMDTSEIHTVSITIDPLTISGNSAGDEITLGDGSHVVNANDGNDVIILKEKSGTYVDVISGGAGVDTLIIDPSYTTDSMFFLDTDDNHDGTWTWTDIYGGKFTFDTEILVIGNNTYRLFNGGTSPGDIDSELESGAENYFLADDVGNWHYSVYMPEDSHNFILEDGWYYVDGNDHSFLNVKRAINPDTGQPYLEGAQGVTVYGSDDDDNIDAWNGDDVIYGGDGPDNINPRAGADLVYAGAGDDEVFIYWPDELLLSSEMDGVVHDILIDGGDGRDMLTFIGSDQFGDASGGLTIIMDDLVRAANFEDINIELVFTGPAAIDAEQFSHDYVEGNAADNRIYTAHGDDTILGGDGSDELFGEEDDDVLYGGAGDDYLLGDGYWSNWNNDDYDLRAGHDYLDGGVGDDELYGYNGNDILIGGDGYDWIEGGFGHDIIYGGAGGDDFYGDVSIASGGTDVFVIEPDADSKANWAYDFVNGEDYIGLFGGLTFAELTFTTHYNTEWDEHGVLISSATEDLLFLIFDDVAAAEAALPTIGAEDFVTISGAAETFAGTGGDDVFVGWDGDDAFSDGAGSDILFGGAGNDTFTITSNGANAADLIIGGPGEDTLIFDPAFYSNPGMFENRQLVDGMNVWTDDDTQATITFDAEFVDFGGIVYEVNDGNLNYPYNFESLDLYTNKTALAKTQFNVTPNMEFENGYVSFDHRTVLLFEDYDTEPGEGGTFSAVGFQEFAPGVTVYGSAYDDFITGSTGADALFGGAGDDQIALHGGADVIDGGAGNDWIFIHDTADLANASSVEGGAGVCDRLIITGNHDDADASDISNPDGVVFSLSDWDAITGIEDLEVHVVDQNGASIATDDILYGNDQANWIYAGMGDDEIYGGDGENELYGAIGDDLLVGGADIDMLFGGFGDDQLTGAGGDDDLYGDAGNDHLYGDAGIDDLYGDDGNDYIEGGSEGDFLYGERGSDMLYGESGQDTLVGGTGSDYLNGGADKDVLTGNDGADYFYLSLTDGAATLADADHITDFDGLLDQLVLEEGLTIADLSIGTDVDGAYITTGGKYLAVVEGWTQADLADATYFTTLSYEGDNWDGTTAAESYQGSIYKDWLYGGGGDDVLEGGLGNDRLHGEGDSDTLYGEDGDDDLDGGPGEDFLYGGADADYFIVRPGEGPIDHIMDFSVLDGDELWVETSQSTDTLSGYIDGADVVVTYEDADLVRLVDFDPADFASLIWQKTNSYWTETPDPAYTWWTDSGGDNIIQGADGDVHTIYITGPGDDVVYLGLKTGVNNYQLVDGGQGNDTVVFHPDYVTDFTELNVYILDEWEVAEDILVFQDHAGLESQVGINAENIVIADTVFDEYVASALSNYNTLVSDSARLTDNAERPYGAMYDTNGLNVLNALISLESKKVILVEDDTPNVFDDRWMDQDIEDYYNELTSFDWAIFDSTAVFDDLDGVTVVGSGNTNIIISGAGDDTLIGGGLLDLFKPGAGSDVLTGGAGNDEFYLSHQDDLFEDALLDGGEGQDALLFGGKEAWLDSASAADDWRIVVDMNDAGAAVNVEKVIVSITNHAGEELATDDEITGDDQANYLWSGAGDDILDGGAGNDELEGGAGDDTLMGGLGDDELDGWSGDDIYVGGEGSDVLYLGDGREMVVLGPNDGGATAAEADQVHGFTLGEDRIALTGGISYFDITFEQGTGVNANDALVKHGADVLAVLIGVDAAALGYGDTTYYQQGVGTNAPPTAGGRVTHDVAEDGSVLIAGMGEINGEVGDSIGHYVLHELPQHGVLFLDADGDGLRDAGETALGSDAPFAADAALVYAPYVDFNGRDNFSYGVIDSYGAESVNQGWVELNVAAVNDAPEAADLTWSTMEDMAGKGVLRATDVDGNALTFTKVSDPAHGQVDIDAETGIFTYTPETDYFGIDSFTYTVSDGALSTTAALTVNVASVNDAPTATGGAATVLEGGTALGALGGSDADDNLIQFVIVDAPTKGALTNFDAASGAFTYAAAADAEGIDLFTYKITDGSGESNVAAYTMTITPVNDAPIATAGGTLTVNEGGTSHGVFRASDADGDALIYAIDSALNGQAVILDAAAGTFSFTPDDGFTGAGSITFKVSDNGGATYSAPETVAVTVVSLPNAPTADNIAADTDEGAAFTVTLTSSANDSGMLTYALVDQPTLGAVSNFDAAAGTFTYTPNPDANGVDVFTYTVTDGVGASNVAAVKIDIAATPDAPTAADAAVQGTEGKGLSGFLAAEDKDGDVLTYHLVENAAQGNVTVDAATGVFTYDPTNTDFSGADAFTFKVSDDGGATFSNVGTVTLNMAAVNDTPTSSDLSMTVTEDGTVSGSLLGADVDAGDSLTYQIRTTGSKGVVKLTDAATGAFTYKPFSNVYGSDAFTYRVSDGTEWSAESTVGITIDPVSEAPIAYPGVLALNEDAQADTFLLGWDADGEALTYEIVTGPTHGDITGLDSATGAFTYTPDSDYAGVDLFSYRVTDAGGATSVESNVNVLVYDVNDAPGAGDDALRAVENAPLSIAISRLIGNDTDIDDASLDITEVAAGTNGTVAIDGDNVIFTPDTDFTGAATFSYTVEDGRGGTTTGDVSVTVETPITDVGGVINGSSGDEIIFGGAGADNLSGGGGSDIFRYTATTDSVDGAEDVISDFNALAGAENDTIWLEGITNGDFSFVGDETNAFTGNGDASARFDTTTDTLQIDADGDAAADMEIVLTDAVFDNLDTADFMIA